MKIMCDTNVIIDVLLEREPFVEESYRILELCEGHKIDGFVSASSVTDIYYLVRKYTHSTDMAYKAVRIPEEGKGFRGLPCCYLCQVDTLRLYCHPE